MTDVSTFGITPSNPDNTPALQAALNAGYRSFHFNEPAIYNFLDTIQIPQGVRAKFTGVGFGMTTLRLASPTGRSLFNYYRPVGAPMSIVEIEDFVFVWAGANGAAASNAISFIGANESVSDSWVRVENCMFYSFEADVKVANATMNHFTGNWHAFGTYAYILGRGASFTHFTRVFSFNKNAVYARDDMDDAFSNGMFVEQCNFITAEGGNMFVRGWQAVFITNCGFDLGSAGQAALWFRACQDVRLSQSFISSNGVAQRDGVFLDGTHSYSIRGNTIVNNAVGVRVVPPTAFSPANGTIVDNTFDGNATNDILLLPGCKGVKIKDNHHKKQMSRTGTNYEIYGNFPGVDGIIVAHNSFAGVAYPIAMGSNSFVSENLFNVHI